MSIEKYISPYIANQLPRLYREEGPVFIAFIKAYFEFLEQQGQVLNESRSLLDYRDIDKTLDEFIVHFKNKYMTGLPENLLGDQRTLQKHIKEIYSSKGTIRGLELVFRLLANQTIDVYYPGDDILKPSDGVWIEPIYLEVSTNSLNVLLIGEKVTGRETGATAIVEDFQTRYINNRKINILYLSNVRGQFKTGEILLNNVIEDPLLSPSVIGSMSNILINESGFDYKIGDILEVIGGNGILGRAVVSNTSPRSGSVEFKILNGGSGYANNNAYAPTTVSVVAVDANNPGIGATFEIGNLGDTEIITTPVDIIAPYANTSLGAVDYGFPTFVPAENINTPLDQALNVQDITVGTILTLRAINPGAGYNGPVIVTVHNDVIGGLNLPDPLRGNTIKGLNANVSGAASAGRGAIDTVNILDSGLGYQEGDVVTLFNANNAFIAGGTITLGHEGKGEGFWKNTRSFLNSDKYIQDSFYYQEYSFEVRVALAFNQYADVIKRLWQPAGTEAFGKVVVGQEIETGSTIEEVAIDAIFLTAYMTAFNTLVTTNKSTSTAYGSLYATTYITNKLTDTQRTTTTSLLDTIPDRIVNGQFNTDIAGWQAVGSSVVNWNSNVQRLRITKTGGDALSYQTILTTAGRTYYVQGEYDIATANATGAAMYASTGTSNTGYIATQSKTGLANTFKFTFVAASGTTNIILEVSGVDGDVVRFDNISVKELPELTRGTVYNTNKATTTSFITTRSTNKATTTTFDTALITNYITQQLTVSLYATNRATTRTTSSVYNTVFATIAATNRLTDTTRATVLQTNFATATAFNTTYDTFFASNRATSTLGTTAYETSKSTSALTSSVYNTTISTNKATDTVIITNKATNRLTDTTISTAFVTTFNTTFGTSGTTTTSFDTTRTTTFDTTITTSYVSSFATVYSTNKATATSISTSKATATSIGTSKATATSASTSKATLTSKATTTSFNTTTTYNTEYSTFSQQFNSITQPPTPIEIFTIKATSRATGTSRSTTTAYNTTTTYVTNFNTTTSFVSTYNTTTTYVSSFNTTTTFNTSTTTTIATSRNTSFATNRATIYATSKSTATTDATTVATTANTLRNTAYGTTTAFVTSYNTDFATTTTFNTAKSTQIATATTITTAYDTVVATTRVTDTTFDTFQPTTKGTSKNTTTIFGTGIITTFQTLTAFSSTYDTNRSTQKSTATAYDTVFDTGTTHVTDVVTSRTTLFNTNKATTSVFNTTYTTNKATTSVFDTSRSTTYVDVPTTFQTFYGTLTQAGTDYDTAKSTQRLTASNYDTGYDTARVTSINTSTDLTF